MDPDLFDGTLYGLPVWGERTAFFEWPGVHFPKNRPVSTLFAEYQNQQAA
jgi:hypothetical protein